MGDPVQLQLVTAAGETFTLRPDRPAAADQFALVGFDRGYPAARDVVEDIPGSAGTLDFTSLASASSHTVDVKVFDVDGDTRHQAVNRLRAAVSPTRWPDRSWLRALFPGDNTWWRAYVRGTVSSPITAGAGASEYLPVRLDLIAPDGVWLSDDQFYGQVRGGVLTGGYSYPVTYPLSLGGGVAGYVLVVENTGLEPAPPVYRIRGYAKNPDIRSGDGSKRMLFNGLTVAAGHYVDVDTATRTALYDGDVDRPVSKYVRPVDGSTWWDFGPGSNEVVFNADTLGDTSILEIYWHTRMV